jgi:hypothetical protein
MIIYLNKVRFYSSSINHLEYTYYFRQYNNAKDIILWQY